MLKRWVTLLSLLLSCGWVNAAGLDISLSNRTANFLFLTDTSSLGYGGADMGIGVFYDEYSNYMAHAHLLVMGHRASENRPVQFGVGAKAYAATLDQSSEKVVAVGLGGLVRYTVPAQMPVGLSLEGYYAPEITSFSDTKDLRQIDARVEVEVMPTTRAYLGHRYMKARLNGGGSVELDNLLHFGIRLTF